MSHTRNISPIVTYSKDLPDLTNTFIGNGEYHLTKLLGMGSFGRVYLAEEVPTGEIYAVKCMPKNGNTWEQEVELHFQASMYSTHVTKVEAIILEHDCVFVIMRYYAGGELYYAIHERNVYANNTSLLKQHFFQLLDALIYMHSVGVYHRDLKPENIIMSEDDQNVYIADFGLATDKAQCTTRAGTKVDMAPECLNRDGDWAYYHPGHTDLWSLGCVLFHMVTGARLWEEAHTSDPHYNYFTEVPSYFADLYSLSPAFNDLVQKLFHPRMRTWMDLYQLRDAVEYIDEFVLDKSKVGAGARWSPSSYSTSSDASIATPLSDVSIQTNVVVVQYVRSLALPSFKSCIA
ncbi:kinase-like domain-containing protein [Flagelloscypha sp. PMI_526]|nr:kinase-like domain-containing protein [Flagelloscypha sp. PMI_526]